MASGSARKELIFIVALWLVAGTSAAWAQTFPDVEQLPSHPELPDPLRMFDGTPVTTRDQWYQQRRPELKALFQHYVYGYFPPAPEKMETKVERVDPQFLGGKASKREVTLRFGPAGTPPIHLLLIVPNQRTRPAPVFVSLNFCGNHEVVPDDGIAVTESWVYKKCQGNVDNHATADGRGEKVDFWCVENMLDRGYAFATFHNCDVDPDLPEFTNGIHPFYFKPGQTEPAAHDWGTIAAWAWGVQRAVDYLISDADIDRQRICAIGHSRLGKTVLLATAFDERIALVVPHQSGTGGCALSRNNTQETVEKINKSFPHWFNDTFPKFGGQEDKLPLDQHLLIALVAPRPLLDTEGLQDKWANYDNAYRALQAADVVYKFLGGKGLSGTVPFQGDDDIRDPETGELMQYRRDTIHTLNREYWNKILDFADSRLKVEAPSGAGINSPKE